MIGAIINVYEIILRTLGAVVDSWLTFADFWLCFTFILKYHTTHNKSSTREELLLWRAIDEFFRTAIITIES